MAISKLKIKNFKCFKNWFTIDFKKGINVLVGNNGAGKTTILEAINLALTGFYHGKNIKNELSQYLFNNDIVNEYLKKVNEGNVVELPEIIIEVYFDETVNEFLGDGNTENSTDQSGISLSISFDERYISEYKTLCSKWITSLPIEYYEVNMISFARENITPRNIPVKSALIDTTSYTPINGSDIYISRIIKNLLEENEIIDVSQAHRLMKDTFSKNKGIESINKKLTNSIQNELTIGVDFGTRNSWENSLVTKLSGVPYNNIGKGNQCIIKTQLALSDKKIKDRQLILVEEPESHLSYSNLNIILNSMNESNDKQIIITTHSSFVLNKLGLENLILINKNQTLRLSELSRDTTKFFKKVSGYDTLRLLLSSKSILVEGDSDELIVQRAYMDSHNGKLPIYDGVDIIAVGTSFLRFLEIAEILNLSVSVITDNDGDIEKLKSKYRNYLNENSYDNIVICFDDEVHNYNGNLKEYNFNTLEPCLLRANNVLVMNEVLGKNYVNEDELLGYMKNNKTEVALSIFESKITIKYPEYIKKGL